MDQDSVVVHSMGEWAILSNVTMQIGTATGTGGMAISSTIGSLFLTTVSGSDWIPGIILRRLLSVRRPGLLRIRTVHRSVFGADGGAVQSDLAREGYYRGVIDGVYGPQTRVAITRYQSNHGLQVTGSLTPATLESLGLPNQWEAKKRGIVLRKCRTRRLVGEVGAMEVGVKRGAHFHAQSYFDQLVRESVLARRNWIDEDFLRTMASNLNQPTCCQYE